MSLELLLSLTEENLFGMVQINVARVWLFGVVVRDMRNGLRQN